RRLALRRYRASTSACRGQCVPRRNRSSVGGRTLTLAGLSSSAEWWFRGQDPGVGIVVRFLGRRGANDVRSRSGGQHQPLGGGQQVGRIPKRFAVVLFAVASGLRFWQSKLQTRAK